MSETTPEKFRPSNSDHGDWFMAKWCDKCASHNGRGSGSDDFCPILWDTMIHRETDPEYPSEWIYRNGQPTCTAFKPKDMPALLESIRDDKTVDMFEATSAQSSKKEK